MAILGYNRHPRPTWTTWISETIIALVSHTHQPMHHKTSWLAEVTAEAGLSVRKDKTKVIYMNITKDDCIVLGGEILVDVTSFTYLGSKVAKREDQMNTFKNKSMKQDQYFWRLKPIWKSEEISQKTNLRTFSRNVKTVLSYEAVTRKTTKNTTHKHSLTNAWQLPSIFSGLIRVRNEELWERAGQESVEMVILQWKYCWAFPYWNSEVNRSKGRPKTTWQR